MRRKAAKLLQAQSFPPFSTKQLENEEDQMMIVKMLLCALALMLGQAQATESKPQPQPGQKVEKKAKPKAEKKAPAKVAKKSDRKADRAVKAKSAATSATTEKVVDGVRLSDVEVHIVSYTNEERVRYGLPPLEVDKELMGTAREQAAWMTRNQAMVHTRRPLAENIAMGQPHSSDVVQSWMNSSGHRANILNPGHRRIGVAAYRTRGGVIFWCQQFQP
jgi:uncharacterized protein YkwD